MVGAVGVPLDPPEESSARDHEQGESSAIVGFI